MADTRLIQVKSRFMADRGDKTQHIGDAIRSMLRKYQLTQKFDEQVLIAAWERLVGKPVARHTTRLYIRDKVLFIQLDSASIKQDLTYGKARIIEIIEAEFGAGVIRDIVLM